MDNSATFIFFDPHGCRLTGTTPHRPTPHLDLSFHLRLINSIDPLQTQVRALDSPSKPHCTTSHFSSTILFSCLLSSFLTSHRVRSVVVERSRLVLPQQRLQLEMQRADRERRGRQRRSSRHSLPWQKQLRQSTIPIPVAVARLEPSNLGGWLCRRLVAQRHRRRQLCAGWQRLFSVLRVRWQRVCGGIIYRVRPSACVRACVRACARSCVRA